MKDALDKHADAEITAAIATGNMTSGNAYTRHVAATRGIILEDPDKKKEPLPDGLADADDFVIRALVRFGEKTPGYVNFIVAAIGAAIAFYKMGMTGPSANMWQAPLVGAIVGFCVLPVIRGLLVLAWTFLKYIVPLILLLWLAFQFVR
jgi:hypothetical protein